MLEEGKTPNVAGPQKMTPLLDAAFIGSSGAMKILLDHGAKVNARNAVGFTALFHSRGDIEKVRLLLAHDADTTLSAPGAPPLGTPVTALAQGCDRARRRSSGARVARQVG